MENTILKKLFIYFSCTINNSLHCFQKQKEDEKK